jgi:hypothetical protein
VLVSEALPEVGLIVGLYLAQKKCIKKQYGKDGEEEETGAKRKCLLH